MSEEISMEALGAAAQEWIEASEAVHRWKQEHMAFWWPESQEPPAAPKVVTQEALDQLERLRLEEQKAQDRFNRINRGLLGLTYAAID